MAFDTVKERKIIRTNVALVEGVYRGKNSWHRDTYLDVLLSNDSSYPDTKWTPLIIKPLKAAAQDKELFEISFFLSPIIKERMAEITKDFESVKYRAIISLMESLLIGEHPKLLDKIDKKELETVLRLIEKVNFMCDLEIYNISTTLDLRYRKNSDVTEFRQNGIEIDEDTKVQYGKTIA